VDRSHKTGESDRLYDVLLNYLESSECGARPDTAAFLARHPEFAPELQEFLDTQDRLEALAAPVREMSQAIVRTVHSGSLFHGTAGATPERATAPAPVSVGQYEILGEIGRGGMGVVYKARDRKLGRHVAVKMIRSAGHASPTEVARFLAEARAKARLNHPNVVPVYEIGEADRLPYFVMALVDGGSLQARLAEGPLPAVQAADLIRQVTLAIQHAHERGVLHRDLKPHNILLQYGGDIASCENGAAGPRGARAPGPGQPVPMVSDFGVARLTGQDGLTATGDVLGTPGYMPPEQAGGLVQDVGPHSDVYSLGAVLYCLVTGRPPYQSATLVETLRLVQEQDPVPPRRLNPAVPKDLESVCLKCLEKAPQRRYARAADLADDLKRFLDGTPTLAKPPRTVGRLWRWARRRPALAGMGAACAAALLTLAAGAIAYTLQLRAHNEELASAREQERLLKEEAEARGCLLQRRAYAVGIHQAAECWENLRQQMRDQNSGRPVPDVLTELPPARDCLLSRSPGGPQEDLRGFEWYYLRRLGRGLRVLRGHRSDVADVALAQGGRLALSAAGSDAVLWDVASGQQVWRMRLGGAANHAAMTPDGRWMALTENAADNTPGGQLREDVLVWDRQSGERVARLTFGAAKVAAVEFSPDGAKLAAIGEGGAAPGLVVVWEVGTWKQCFRRCATGGGTALAFSPDGRTLAEALSRGQGPNGIRLHDLQTGEERSILMGRVADGIIRLAFAPDGRTLASGGFRGQVVLWDVAKGTPQKDWTVPAMQVSGLGFLPGGETVAVAAKTAAGVRPGRACVQLWDAASGRPCSDVWGPGSLIHNLAVAPDRSVALACGDDTVRLWNPEQLAESRALPWNHKETWAVAFAPDGRTLATCGDDEKIKLWDVASNQPRATVNGHTCLVSCVAFHPGGKFGASADYDGGICLWDAESGSLLRPTLKASPAPLRCLAFTPDGRILATGGRDCRIRLWNVRTGEDGHPDLSLLAELAGHEKDVLCLAFSANGKMLVSGSDDRTIRFWDCPTGSCVRTVEESGPVRSTAFGPDGRLAWSADEGEVKLAAPAEGSPVQLLAGHAGRVRALTFTPDGRTLAAAGDDQKVRLWQAATGQLLLTLRGHDKEIYAASFAPNNRLLATGCFDGTIRLWLAEPDGL
jgi:WD40 repeat protein/serine/threonine protein kinase